MESLIDSNQVVILGGSSLCLCVAMQRLGLVPNAFLVCLSWAFSVSRKCLPWPLSCLVLSWARPLFERA